MSGWDILDIVIGQVVEVGGGESVEDADVLLQAAARLLLRVLYQ
jgi:hypothetical protein